MIIPKHGGRDVLTYVTDFEAPEPDRGEVIVKVGATGVNRIDLLVRGGYPGVEIPLPHIPGGDIAGVIEKTGEGVEGIEPGMRVVVYPVISCGVCALCREQKQNLCLGWRYFGLHVHGGYAEYVAVPADNLVPLPEGISFEEAVEIPVAGLTAYHALKSVGNLKPGETFFIWGGSGGMGTIAIQIAKHLGATVIATANSDEKLEAMKKLGADHVFNRETDDIPEEVKKIAPAGIDLAIDYVGPETFPKSFNMLKKGGTLLLCGIITGRETQLSIHMTYLRHISIRGLYLGTLDEMKELTELVASGAVKPTISAVLPLADAAEAHRRMESGEHFGKLVLMP